jgi:hypothetical protein
VFSEQADSLRVKRRVVDKAIERAADPPPSPLWRRGIPERGIQIGSIGCRLQRPQELRSTCVKSAQACHVQGGKTDEAGRVG